MSSAYAWRLGIYFNLKLEYLLQVVQSVFRVKDLFRFIHKFENPREVWRVRDY